MADCLEAVLKLKTLRQNFKVKLSYLNAVRYAVCWRMVSFTLKG
jgi:hypothetical protein